MTTKTRSRDTHRDLPPVQSAPDQAADGPAEYEGRPLPHPEEEVVDQGLSFDVVTLLSRRGMLGILGAGAAGLTLAACSDPASAGTDTGDSTLTEIPDETAGPYPGDGSNGPDVLDQSGIVRSDITSSFGEADGVAEGVPMELELTILDLADGGVPFAGVAVYVWHCTRDGKYSMYSEGITEENYLRGVQIADDDGVVRFTSIFPACYSGRWPHIHFEVYPDQESITDSSNAISTSQVALPEDICDEVYATEGYEQSVQNLSAVTLDSDMVFSDGADSQLATVTGDADSGYTVALKVGVDTTTEPTEGSGGPGGEGGPDGGEGAPEGSAPGGEGGPDGEGGPGGGPQGEPQE